MARNRTIPKRANPGPNATGVRVTCSPRAVIVPICSLSPSISKPPSDAERNEIGERDLSGRLTRRSIGNAAVSPLHMLPVLVSPFVQLVVGGDDWNWSASDCCHYGGVAGELAGVAELDLDRVVARLGWI